MACLCRRGVGVPCFEFVCVVMWSFVLASVGVALLFGSLLDLVVSVGAVCVGLALLL
jgi:hypothetical protein